MRGWRAIHDPDPSQQRRGEILFKEKLIVIYDQEADDAWEILLHELTELRLRRVLAVYREAFNALVGVLQKIAYIEKERFLESVPLLIRRFDEAAGETLPGIFSSSPRAFGPEEEHDAEQRPPARRGRAVDG